MAILVSEDKLRKMLDLFADDAYGMEISNATPRMWQKLYDDFIEECKKTS